MKQLKTHQIIDEYDTSTDKWIARYAIVAVEPYHVEALCYFDALKRDYIGETCHINTRCIFDSKTFYWKINGVQPCGI